MNSFVRSCKKAKAAVLQKLLRINMTNLLVLGLYDPLSSHHLNLVGLASTARTMILAADAEAGDPAKQCDKHKCSGSPC